MAITELTSRKRSITCLLRRALDDGQEPSRKAARIIIGLPKLAEEAGRTGNDDEDPNDLLLRLVRSKGADVEVSDSLTLDGFFAEYSEEEISSYDTIVINAIRKQDVTQLRSFHASGRPLKCSNKFGESLLHMACRRNFLGVAQFLIQEANVTVRLRDDYGRTILHDAAWACEPNFELIELILSECPDLLYFKDQRGHAPLAYARKAHWSAWNKFLKERSDLIVPTTLLKQST